MKVPLIGSQDFWDNSRKKSDSLLLKAVNNEILTEKCDAEIISNIDPVYFKSSDFDFARFELEVCYKLLLFINHNIVKCIILYSTTKYVYFLLLLY